jgi:toxin ParE1/3/4
VHAIEVLAHNPLIGRPVANGKRELVIGRKARGYIALYHYIDKIDTVLVLAIKSQREAGFGPECWHDEEHARDGSARTVLAATRA